jgi:hypothetical protein
MRACGHAGIGRKDGDVTSRLALRRSKELPPASPSLQTVLSQRLFGCPACLPARLPPRGMRGHQQGGGRQAGWRREEGRPLGSFM